MKFTRLLLDFLLYSTFGYILSSSGFGITTYQYWSLLVILIFVNLMSFRMGLNEGEKLYAGRET